MNINVSDKDYIICRTPQGHVHLSFEEEKTTIYWNRHSTITLSGKHRECPLLEVDSDEEPTRLHVKQTESVWEEREFVI